MLEISVISRMLNKIADICNTFDELFFVFTEKNVCFFCFFFVFFALRGKTFFALRGKN